MSLSVEFAKRLTLMQRAAIEPLRESGYPALADCAGNCWSLGHACRFPVAIREADLLRQFDRANGAPATRASTHNEHSSLVTERRHFTDSAGVRWTVYDAVSQVSLGPTEVPSTAQFRPPRTYLLFESERETRRLAPIPQGWREFAPEELERLLLRASVIAIRRPKRDA